MDASQDVRDIAAAGDASPGLSLLCCLIDAGLIRGLFELTAGGLVNGGLAAQQVTAGGRSFCLIVTEDPGAPPAGQVIAFRRNMARAGR